MTDYTDGRTIVNSCVSGDTSELFVKATVCAATLKGGNMMIIPTQEIEVYYMHPTVEQKHRPALKRGLERGGRISYYVSRHRLCRRDEIQQTNQHCHEGTVFGYCNDNIV